LLELTRTKDMPPRIALIHATPLSIAPIGAAFRELWPQAATTNLLDDSLSADLAAAGRLEPRMVERFLTLGRYVAADRAAAILFTCSAFGPAIEAVQAALPIPVLKPNEAAIDEALDRGGRIALIASFAPTLASMHAEFGTRAAQRGLALDLALLHAEGAMEALAGGDAKAHDDLIAAAAGRAKAETLVLAQFSTARAAALVAERTGKEAITTPASAVLRLKKELAASS
jgi:Asp/Glu/Hydantoin racemase